MSEPIASVALPPSPPVSPTGKALIPPGYVPYIGAAWVGIGAGAQTLPDGPFKHWLNIALMLLGPLMGMLCPGIRSAPKAFVIAAAVMLVGLHPSVAHADWSVGPSIPLLRLDTGGRTSLAPGAGVMGGYGWKLARCPGIGGGQDCLHLDAALFGSLFGQVQAEAAGSVAIVGCYGHNLACVGFGIDLASTQGGAFSGFTWRRNSFVLGAIGLEALAAIAAGHAP